MAFDNLNLEKGMYAMPGKSFTQVLEELDNSAQYAGTPLEGLDAYQRQLKRFDIHTDGTCADRLEKFFRSSNSATLFPEYIARTVKEGMAGASVLKEIVATVTEIEAMDYRFIMAESEDDAYNLVRTDESVTMPTTYVHTQNGLVNLRKRGRVIAGTYEAVRFHKLSVFGVLLRQIGAFMAAGLLQDAVNTLVDGDGVNDGAAVKNLTSGMTYNDLMTLWGDLAPYRMTTLVGGTTACQQVMNLAEMKDSAAGNCFHATGKLATPMGASLIHVPTMEKKQLVAVDKNCCLEMVQAGGILTDYDKLIDRQMDRTTISVTVGFAQLFPNAARVLNCN